ncbi:MAG: hypothetical protein FWH11_01215 [Micrococcales bacterium]|nr:hypothetical protein [Micrococcales bacterium]
MGLPTPRLTLGGLDLWGVDADGTRWVVETSPAASGWWSSAPSTLVVEQRAGSDGGWPNAPVSGPKRVAFSGSLVARDQAAARRAVDRLHAALPVGPVVAVVVEADRSRWCQVHREDQVLVDPVSMGSTVGPVLVRWSVQLVAYDPRLLGDMMTGWTGLPASTGGLRLPFRVPFRIVASATSGEVTMTNPGTVAGRLLMTVTGPVTRPSIRTVAPDGSVLTLTLSLTLGDGETLVVDPGTLQVLAGGTASRAAWVVSRGWPVFAPGTTTWTFSAVAGSGRLDVQAWPAWA